MLQVFRVEHTKTKVGPFQTLNDDFTQELARKAGENRYLKFPGDDGLPLGYLPYCFVFGCQDLATLKLWFCLDDTPSGNERIIQTLKSKGFQLVEFLVEVGDYEVSESGVQVAFHASKAREEGLAEYHDLEVLLS